MSTQFGLPWRVLCVILSFWTADAASRVLYITTSAGYRHDSLETSAAVLKSIGERTGLYDLVHTEDLSLITEASLRTFDAVLFFTSGELALDDSQRTALLDFVRRGKGFGGFHSATDTLYSWQDYGELIGAYFDGHPWTQQARVLKTSDDPVVANIAYPWSLTEEFYQFRLVSAFRTLQTLDTSSVDLHAPGVKASSFPLSWVREHGDGRVFYTALGHFGDTWQSRDFQQLIENAMRWLLEVRATVIAPGGIGNAATMVPADAISPGAIISIYGQNLVPRVVIEGQDAKLLYTSAQQINAVVPLTVAGQAGSASVTVGSASRPVQFLDMTPGIFAATLSPGAVTVWMTGLGTGEKEITAKVDGLPATILYRGMSPDFPGLYQVNLALPARTQSGSLRVEVAGAQIMVTLP